MRATEISVLSTFGSYEKQVEAARRAFDVQLSGYRWRAIQLMKGQDRKGNRYVFNPPAVMEWEVERDVQ
jgi:hypothetical protein